MQSPALFSAACFVIAIPNAVQIFCRIASASDTTPTRRRRPRRRHTRFFATIGLFSTLLFALAVVVQTVPIILRPPC